MPLIPRRSWSTRLKHSCRCSPRCGTALMISWPKQFTTLMEEQSYVINSFDVSFHEGLAFFGIDELFVRPIGLGTNFLGITAKKSTDIKYEGQFAVDWLDHNVLIFRDRAIRIVSLLRPGYTREIYNGSKEVRNIVVSTRGFFFAWIENDNNIRRMSKDSLQAPIVHTEKSKIFCMTLDEETKRFFYYIGGQGFTLQRSVRAGGGKKNKGKKTSPPPPNRTRTTTSSSTQRTSKVATRRNGRAPFGCEGVKSEPVQVAKYRGAVFVILQEETKDNNGDFIYRLGQVMRSGEFKEIVENPNWRITSVLKSTGIDANVADLCGRQLNRCPYLCVHVSEDQARCLCRDDAPGCTDHPMTVPADERTSTVAAAIQRQSYVVTTLIVVLLPVVFLLAYCLYTNYLAADEEVAGEGGSSTASSLSAGSAVGSAIGAPADNALKQQQKPSGALHALINWAGLGSADVSSSLLEGEEGELKMGQQSTIGGRNTSTVAAATAAPEPSSAVSEVAESEPPKKRKKRHKHRHKQKTAAKSSAT
ncbi:hypothetical protein TYRP_001057 [Tyrophagus putrescentiae]|nr:hypothetical protein TYRP_001057 [Tyrophagus putrescentiae]